MSPLLALARPRLVAVVLAAAFLCATAPHARAAAGADAIDEAKRREILDLDAATADSELESYAVIVLLPAAAVLLLIWILRASHHE